MVVRSDTKFLGHAAGLRNLPIVLEVMDEFPLTADFSRIGFNFGKIGGKDFLQLIFW